MAKITDKFEKQHVANIAKYGSQIDAIYKQATQEAAAIAVLIPNYDPSVMFRFEDYPMTQERVRKLLRSLYSSTESVVINGINAEWTLANNKNNELSRLVIGNNVGKLTQAQYRRYFSNNDKAREAFIARKEQGLDLSDKVWRYTNMFKNDIEMGLDLGLRNGLSAAEMSRDLRQYLKHPDMLFRRVRDEHGNLVLSQRAKDFHPGQGVYRSSYMNARRLTVTETNIAYRTADYERVQRMDFVVGIEVCLSNNHNCKGVPTGTFYDICDMLAGKYPKTFKFTGWHPHCRCHTKTILKTPNELMAENQAILDGKEPSSQSVNSVDAVPTQFTNWIKNNEKRIETARQLPYFLRDNGSMKDGKYVLNEFSKPHIPTPLEIAEKRHAKRTQEQIEKIRDEWFERKAVYRYGQSILEYMDGISDVDTSMLADALKGGDASKILKEATDLKSIGKQILSYDKLDNPISVARQTSMTTAKTINDNVARTLSMMPTDLAKRKSKLEFEIKWMGSEGAKRYPETWVFSQNAYKKELASVDYRIKVKATEDSVSGALAFADSSRSKKIKGLASDMRALLSAKSLDFTAAAKKAQELNKEYQKLINKSSKTKSVTLDQLKAKMGNNTPETIKHLDKAIKNYSLLDPKLEQYRAQIEDNMRKLLSNNDYGMDISGTLLDSVYKNGFYNTFQSGTSDGYIGSAKTIGKIEVTHARLGAAHKLFGLGSDLAKDQLSREKYEKYGHLLDRNKKDAFLNNRTWYGISAGGRDAQVQVRFKKDKVVATWTFNDSLSKRFQPTLVTDPKIESFDKALGNKIPLNDNADKLYEWQHKYATSYVELQYHGKLTIDCVESIVFAKKPDKVISNDLINKLKQKKIELYYFDGSDIVAY